MYICGSVWGGGGGGGGFWWENPIHPPPQPFSDPFEMAAPGLAVFSVGERSGPYI